MCTTHYELPGEKLNLERFCLQLDNLNKTPQEKRPIMFNRNKIILPHAKPHIALGTRQKLVEFWT